MTAPAFHDLTAIRPLETERLVLRVPVEADFEDHAAYATSERARFTGGPSDRVQAWRGFIAAIGHWTIRGYGFWQVVERATGRNLGKVGPIFLDGWPEPELAWHLYEGAEGRGYATEAARAARADAATRLGLGPLVSPIHPDNAPSRAVAERLGCTLERVGELLGQPAESWRHPAPVATGDPA